MKRITIIGMGMARCDLTDRQLSLIRQADILIGADRHLADFPEAGAQKKPIDKDLKGLVDYIKSRMADRSIVVLASGDPLFYGIGTYLSKALGAEQVVIYPNITAVAAAFARIKEAWHDAAVISLHGRGQDARFIEAVRSADKLAVLTDPHFNPAYLAQRCLDAEVTDVRMCVLERLGGADERVEWFEPRQAAGMTFAEPNLVVFIRVKPDAAAEPLRLGTKEDLYEHEQGLITKAEVRAVTLSKLQLDTGHILWDLGAGSGSVGIEASLLVRNGRILSVEKNRERVSQIERNRRRFTVNNLEVVQGILPGVLDDLPSPDRVFIGGGGKDLVAIIRKAASRLKTAGRIVTNTVLLSNLASAISAMEDMGLRTDTVQVQVNRSRSMPWGERLVAENPVWIITGRKPDGQARRK